jgi:hypothetical protein
MKSELQSCNYKYLLIAIGLIHFRTRKKKPYLFVVGRNYTSSSNNVTP